MEAHAARMRARESKKLESQEWLGRPIRDGRESRGRDRSAEWKMKDAAIKASQVSGLLAAHERRKAAAKKRRDSKPTLVVEAPPMGPQPGKKGRLPGTKNFLYDYPNCPRCTSSSVVRAGYETKSKEQRYRCRACRKTFYAEFDVIYKPVVYHLTCYRCGGTGELLSFVRYKGRRSTSAGAVGNCTSCGKKFTQGGPEHLERTMCLLLDRVEALGLPEEIQAEVLQQASLEILEGLAYTWNVPLNVSRAREATRRQSRETAKFRMNERSEDVRID